MYILSDWDLMESYEDAKDLGLNARFIQLLEKEMAHRGLL